MDHRTWPWTTAYALRMIYSVNKKREMSFATMVQYPCVLYQPPETMRQFPECSSQVHGEFDICNFNMYRIGVLSRMAKVCPKRKIKG